MRVTVPGVLGSTKDATHDSVVVRPWMLLTVQSMVLAVPEFPLSNTTEAATALGVNVRVTGSFARKRGSFPMESVIVTERECQVPWGKTAETVPVQDRDGSAPVTEIWISPKAWEFMMESRKGPARLPSEEVS